MHICYSFTLLQAMVADLFSPCVCVAAKLMRVSWRARLTLATLCCHARRKKLEEASCQLFGRILRVLIAFFPTGMRTATLSIQIGFPSARRGALITQARPPRFTALTNLLLPQRALWSIFCSSLQLLLFPLGYLPSTSIHRVLSPWCVGSLGDRSLMIFAGFTRGCRARAAQTVTRRGLASSPSFSSCVSHRPTPFRPARASDYPAYHYMHPPLLACAHVGSCHPALIAPQAAAAQAQAVKPRNVSATESLELVSSLKRYSTGLCAIAAAAGLAQGGGRPAAASPAADAPPPTSCPFTRLRHPPLLLTFILCTFKCFTWPRNAWNRLTNRFPAL